VGLGCPIFGRHVCGVWNGFGRLFFVVMCGDSLFQEG
jgi:hypothetical protein